MIKLKIKSQWLKFAGLNECVSSEVVYIRGALHTP